MPLPIHPKLKQNIDFVASIAEHLIKMGYEIKRWEGVISWINNLHVNIWVYPIGGKWDNKMELRIGTSQKMKALSNPLSKDVGKEVIPWIVQWLKWVEADQTIPF